MAPVNNHSPFLYNLDSLYSEDLVYMWYIYKFLFIFIFIITTTCSGSLSPWSEYLSYLDILNRPCYGNTYISCILLMYQDKYTGLIQAHSNYIDKPPDPSSSPCMDMDPDGLSRNQIKSGSRTLVAVRTFLPLLHLDNFISVQASHLQLPEILI